MNQGEFQGTILCKACGLCCTGHLFAWVKLKPSELDLAEALGMQVNRSDPHERGFNQPCPLWKGVCTIYHTPQYPRACRHYQCSLLKDVLAEQTTLPEALQVVERARKMVQELEAVLPVSPNPNFRERLVEQIEHPDEAAWPEDSYSAFRAQADALLDFFKKYFGVTDFLE